MLNWVGSVKKHGFFKVTIAQYCAYFTEQMDADTM